MPAMPPIMHFMVLVLAVSIAYVLAARINHKAQGGRNAFTSEAQPTYEEFAKADVEESEDQGAETKTNAAEANVEIGRKEKSESTSEEDFGSRINKKAEKAEKAGIQTNTKKFMGPQDVMKCNGGATMQTTCLTTSKYQEIVDHIGRIVDELANHGCDKNNCAQADWTGCVLRMAGHDFMDFDGKEGGSDACTDLDFGDNAGLLPCLVNGEFGHSLQEVYTPVCTQVSLADFIVIAGEAVMVKTRKIAQSSNSSRKPLDFTAGPTAHRFKFGRKTRSASCESFEKSHLLPNPEDGCDGVKTTFVDNMKLGSSKHGGPNALAAALMGVHTLGRARKENSGYEGWWSEAGKQKEFTNDYFISMIAKGWMPENMGPKKNQWKRSDGQTGPGGSTNEMMLDSDMCLAYAESGRPVKASRDTCCAWLDPPMDRQMLGLPHGIGIPSALQSFSCTKGKTMSAGRGNCCDGDTRANDCGSPVRLSGFAKDAVIKYATDENAWLEDFKEAWSIATTNGHSGLRPLQSFCAKAAVQRVTCFDNPLGISGQTCASLKKRNYCEFAKSSRRRGWAAKVKESCKETCGACPASEACVDDPSAAGVGASDISGQGLAANAAGVSTWCTKKDRCNHAGWAKGCKKTCGKCSQAITWSCDNSANAGNLRMPSLNECRQGARSMSQLLGSGYQFHCDEWRGRAYLRNSDQCQSRGALAAEISGQNLGLKCSGHMNDGAIGQGRFVGLESCEANIASFNVKMSAKATCEDAAKLPGNHRCSASWIKGACAATLTSGGQTFLVSDLCPKTCGTCPGASALLQTLTSELMKEATETEDAVEEVEEEQAEGEEEATETMDTAEEAEEEEMEDTAVIVQAQPE